MLMPRRSRANSGPFTARYANVTQGDKEKKKKFARRMQEDK